MSGQDTKADGYRCCVCARQASTLVLCTDCASAVQRGDMVPEQISMTEQGPLNACLVDAWGRIFCLDEKTEIGRHPEGFGISVRQGSISRRHAMLEYETGTGFTLTDLKSTNGTKVGHRFLEEKVTLVSGDLLLLGSVGFYFISPRPPLRTGRFEFETFSHGTEGADGTAASAEESEECRSYEPTDLNELESLHLQVIEATGGGGGFVDVAGTQIQVSMVQLELLKLLIKRMERDRARPAAVRGYLHSSEILAEISWDTAHPSDNHIKQLVRRLRRSLARSGRDDLVESQQGLGYRLSVLPTSTSAAP